MHKKDLKQFTIVQIKSEKYIYTLWYYCTSINLYLFVGENKKIYIVFTSELHGSYF